MFQFAVTLQVVLSAGEIPHEVAPIHEIALVGKEETDIFQLGWHLHHDIFATSVVGNFRAVDTTHPRLVSLCMCLVIHAGEEHVLCILQFILVAYNEVGVLFVFVCFLLTLVDGSTILIVGTADVTVDIKFHLRGVCLSVEKRTVTILITAQVVAKCEDVLG